MDVISIVRTLAKSDKYQCIYSNKELGLRLFENNIDFSELQLNFLRYISFYSNIYLDIALGDITDIVLKNETYEDAYMYYRSKEKHKEDKINTNKPNPDGGPTNRWIFKKPPKDV